MEPVDWSGVVIALIGAAMLISNRWLGPRFVKIAERFGPRFVLQGRLSGPTETRLYPMLLLVSTGWLLGRLLMALFATP